MTLNAALREKAWLFTRQYVVRLGALLAATALCVLIGVHVFRALPGILKQKYRNNDMQPRLAEARRVNLAYDEVAARPAEYIGKYVLWCVEKRPGGIFYYRNDPARKIAVENAGNFPDVKQGSQSGGCVEVMGRIEKAETRRSAQGLNEPLVTLFSYGRPGHWEGYRRY